MPDLGWLRVEETHFYSHQVRIRGPSYTWQADPLAEGRRCVKLGCGMGQLVS